MDDKCKECKAELLIYPQIKLCPVCNKGELIRLAKEYSDKYKAYKKL